jgi:hypothetical protein
VRQRLGHSVDRAIARPGRPANPVLTPDQGAGRAGQEIGNRIGPQSARPKESAGIQRWFWQLLMARSPFGF